MMFFLKLIPVAICAELWYRGGLEKRAWMRDVVLPLIVGVYIGLFVNLLVGFFSIGSFLIIRLGYGIEDDSDDGSLLCRFVYHTLHLKHSWLVRGIAGGLYGLIGLLPFVIYTKQFGVYLLYALFNFLINAVGEALDFGMSWFWDRARGAVFGSIFLLI